MRALGAGAGLGADAVVTALLFPQRPGTALVGIPLAGLAWSFGVWLGAGDRLAGLEIGPAQALALVSMGGLAQALALWFGFSAVLWAMTRIAGLPLPLPQLLSLVSGAAPPLWLAAPAGALWLSGAATPAGLVFLGGLSGLGLSVFAALLMLHLAAASGRPHWRAAAALAGTGIFLASFVTLAA